MVGAIPDREYHLMIRLDKKIVRPLRTRVLKP